MLIRNSERVPYVTCKRCGNSFKMGNSCGCGAVQTRAAGNGTYIIDEEDKNVAVIDTET